MLGRKPAIVLKLVGFKFLVASAVRKIHWEEIIRCYFFEMSAWTDFYILW